LRVVCGCENMVVFPRSYFVNGEGTAHQFIRIRRETLGSLVYKE